VSYSVRLIGDIAEVAPLWCDLSGNGDAANFAFQDIRWLKQWYRQFATRRDARAQIAVVLAGADRGGKIDASQVAWMLPLVRRRKFLLPIVEFADRGVTDYNIALPGPRAPHNKVQAQLAFEALAKALRPYAALRLRKMPVALDQAAQPLGLLDDARASLLVGHMMALPATAQAFIDGLGKKKRTEVQRLRRHLEQLGAVRAGMASTAAERQAVFDLILAWQRRRVPLRGDRYFLEDDGYRQFYQSLIDDPTVSDLAIVTGIWLNERPIAGLLGVRRGNRYIALRIGQADDAAVVGVGTGKLLIAETARCAIEMGLEVFDFSLGDNSLKQWFHPQAFPLFEIEWLFNGLVRRPRMAAV
jgi:CelD/BcsL family acetyltransferase involved in cellulose biosynthesis